MAEDKFAEYVRKWAPLIDQHLAQQQQSLRGRVLSAAIHFVENVVVEIEGDTKDSYSEKPWFAIIYWHFRKWYEDFYGEQLKQSSDELAGFVYVSSTPFELHIPITKAEIAEEGISSTMIFPVEVCPEDELKGWFRASPNLEMLPVESRATLVTEVERIVRDTRTLNLGLMTATLEDSTSKDLAGSVIGHLRTATTLVMSNNPEGQSVAVWELHMAAEKAIKIFLGQKFILYPRTHDLSELRDLTQSVIDSTEIDADFENMVSGSDAIGYRYCEGNRLSSSTLFSLYMSVLAIASFYADNLDRKYGVKNARITFKKPPWSTLPNGEP